LYDADADEHRRRALEIGLDCPAEVFEQLFRIQPLDPLLLVAVASIDWLPVRWREAELSGTVLAQVGLPRSFEAGVQSARLTALKLLSDDEQPEGFAVWESAGTWLRPPVLVTGDVAGIEVSYQLLVGRTRLGSLVGLMERGDIPAERHHRVWIGAARSP
jgi:hypothetical protein